MRSRIRSRSEVLKGTYQSGDTITVDAKADGGLAFDSAATAEIV